MPPKTRRGMWTNEALEEAMDVIERRTYSIKRASKSWNIPMNSFFDHVNEKSKSKKMELGGVLTKDDVVMITWTLTMQEYGLSISLQQLKIKICETSTNMNYTISGWNANNR